MFKKLIFFTLAIGLLASCGGNKNQSEGAEGMAQFADDQAFKDAHDTPEANDHQAQGQMVTFATPDGAEGSAYALMTTTASNKYLFVIHEWWGLNDHIKEEADRLFAELGDVNVMALDMYDGQVATSPDEAGKFMQAVKAERAEAIVKGAIAKAGAAAKIGTIGWCFGGGWSLRSSIMAADQGVACVIYYGMPVQKAEELAPLKAEMLGIFAEKDGWINPEVVGKFEDLAKATGKKIEVHQYDAEHAFANPSNPAFNETAASDANAKALAFLKARL
ncbi:MAG: dienelactone hydrolase family protein [Saprospiraceae bacterium]